jgi:tRNA A-37 threonylcarbamoyl transferase component Bud32/tetratricopeptide (TPR) repeat protein
LKPLVEEVFHAVADLSAEAREQYFAQRGLDERTRKEVEALVAFDPRSSILLERDVSMVAEGALATLESKDIRCGPYRLGELLGRGGMGAVYAAERVDGEVTQRVAVKLLRPAADDSLLRQRFLEERQILATLSHPNIARLVDVGHREDSQPYLVMEYIEGKPIDVCTAGFSIRQKIVLFLKVCAAVGYLHRNLVVHRDLKPPNILVTGEGEPKLLDFGIAKMLDLSTDSTVTGMRILTPDYASPEQVAGSQVTTATDIYSLGAVLYKMLTGVAPHQFENDSARAIAFAISSGKIPPPSKLVPALRGDLEMILMKALRTEPQERYSTIEQFSEDLENFLQSRPIRARKGDAWYQTRKFLRRRWLPVAATALAVAGLTGGVLVANRQRAIAERRFVQVRQLSGKLFDIDAIVRQTPGTTKARELIVSTSLEYLQRLATDAPSDPEIALEVANAYLRVARVQGVPVNSNLGHTEEADRSLQKAEALLVSVLAARPSDRTAILRSAQVAHDRMMLAGDRGAPDVAMAFGRKSADFLQKYESLGSVPRADVESVAATYMNLGGRYMVDNLYDDAIRFGTRAFNVASAAGLDSIGGAALMSVAGAYRVKGDLDQALSTIRESARLLESPTGAKSRGRTMNLITALTLEGQILGADVAINMGRFEEAVAPLERAFALADNNARQDVNDADSRRSAATTGVLLGAALNHVDPRRALAVYDRTLTLLSETPDNPRSRRWEVRALAGSTYPLRRLGNAAEARRRLDTAFTRLGQLKLYPAEQIETGREAYLSLCARADYEADRGELQRALSMYEELLRKVLATEPNPETSLADAVDVSRLYAALAMLHQRARHTDVAIAMNERRLELWRHWAAKLPNNILVRSQLEAAS